MHPTELYHHLSEELRFPLNNYTRKDYAYGSILLVFGVLGVGLPTLLGYLKYSLEGQLNGMDFLPPLEAEYIGDYTFEGVKFILGVILFEFVILVFSWGLTYIPLPELLKLGGVISTIVIGIYALPLLFILFAKTNFPLPQSKSQIMMLIRVGVSFEYMTVWVVLTVFSILATILLTAIAATVILLPIACIGGWYLAIIYARFLGFAASERI